MNIYQIVFWLVVLLLANLACWALLRAKPGKVSSGDGAILFAILALIAVADFVVLFGGVVIGCKVLYGYLGSLSNNVLIPAIKLI